ncbi:unnamed protein product, partial [Ascophyllum nodosum]
CVSVHQIQPEEVGKKKGKRLQCGRQGMSCHGCLLGDWADTPCGLRLGRLLFSCAVVGSMVVSINLFLLGHAVVKSDPIHSTEPDPLSPTESLAPGPKPVVTFGTMGTAHDVRKYGAGDSGFNSTTGDERSAGPLAPG